MNVKRSFVILNDFKEVIEFLVINYNKLLLMIRSKVFKYNLRI
ncbi:MAG: hypothetical protein ACRCZO_20070 [Cetobacterium sp.]